MRGKLQALVDHLSLETIEDNLFRGPSQDLGWGRVYGGQVLAQAIQAAAATVPNEHRIHSMHAYFLLGGDVNRPVLYDVDRIRDGGSFTTRRVVAIQHGRAILNMAASFQKEEGGLEHQDVMPNVPPPEDIPDDRIRNQAIVDKLPAILRPRAVVDTPFDIHTVDEIDDPLHPTPRPPTRMHWMKTSGALPDDFHLHATLLAYASDHSFLTTSLQPHGITWLTKGMQLASIDHAMWFHQPFRMDEWLLYVIESPAASNARALVRGRVFNRQGTLVATTSQEGLIRRHEP